MDDWPQPRASSINALPHPKVSCFPSRLIASLHISEKVTVSLESSHKKEEKLTGDLSAASQGRVMLWASCPLEKLNSPTPIQEEGTAVCSATWVSWPSIPKIQHQANLTQHSLTVGSSQPLSPRGHRVARTSEAPRLPTLKPRPSVSQQTRENERSDRVT